MSKSSKQCDFCCSSYECNNCFKIKFDVIGFEIKCDGKCSKCPCNGCFCGEDLKDEE